MENILKQFLEELNRAFAKACDDADNAVDEEEVSFFAGKQCAIDEMKEFVNKMVEQ